MRRSIVTLAALASVGLAAAAAAQPSRAPDGPFGDGPGARRAARGGMSDSDRAAFLDARIAALHAGLQLNGDQEKLWPPVEEALRGLARQRQEARAARRERWMSMREGDAAPNLPDQLRFVADRQTARAEVLRKLADATTPLYGVLDDGQKRRLHVLARFTGAGQAMRWEGRRGGPMRRGERDGLGPDGPGRFARSGPDRHPDRDAD